MIFVTLGTQDKSFVRLLDAIQKQIDKGVIKEKVVVQGGCTEFASSDMEIFDLCSMDDFAKYMDECDLLITHGGVGSIVNGIKRGKKVIAAARLKQYEEHTNDHQLQILDNFYNEGYILKLDDFDKLGEIIEESKTFKPRKYISNSENFRNKLRDYINNN